MRLFVAVEIPHELRMALDSFLKPLRATAKLSWSRLENLHITTQFLGEWPEARLDEIKQALAKDGVAIEERAFTPHLTLARIREPVPLDALREAIESSPFARGFHFGAFRAGTFYLYLSAGGRYTQLAGFGLE